METYKLNIYAMYYQIYFEDIAYANSYGIIEWNNYQLSTLNYTNDNAIVIATAREAIVPLRINILDKMPIIDYANYDHIVQCAIEIVSGEVCIHGLNDTIDEYKKIKIPKGIYGSLTCFSGLNSIDELGIDGADEYTIYAWMTDYPIVKSIVKQWAE